MLKNEFITPVLIRELIGRGYTYFLLESELGINRTIIDSMLERKYAKKTCDDLKLMAQNNSSIDKVLFGSDIGGRLIFNELDGQWIIYKTLIPGNVFVLKLDKNKKFKKIDFDTDCNYAVFEDGEVFFASCKTDEKIRILIIDDFKNNSFSSNLNMDYVESFYYLSEEFFA